MLRNHIAPSGRADACTGRQLCLVDLPFETAEPISLLFEIMGWEVLSAPPAHVVSGPHEPVMAAETAPRLLMRSAVGPAGETIVAVAVNDPEIAGVLAANGLDRLVVPVSLYALEQLMVFAG